MSFTLFHRKRSKVLIAPDDVTTFTNYLGADGRLQLRSVIEEDDEQPHAIEALCEYITSLEMPMAFVSLRYF